MNREESEQCLQWVTQILGVIRSTGQYEEAFHLIVDRIVRLYKCQTCALILLDPKTEYLVIENSHGISLTFSNGYKRRISTRSIGNLFWTGKPVLVLDSTTDPLLAHELELEHPFGSCLCVQLLVDHRSLGYLHVDSTEKRAFEVSDVRILQAFADFAALAYYKSWLAEENKRLDRIDHETGLEKYPAFLERMNISLEEAKERNLPLSLILCDIDNFKSLSQTYGYEASLQLLKEVGATIRSSLRTIDSAGRYGYDEFCLLRVDASAEDAVEFAKSLCNAVNQTSYTKHQVHSTISVGVAVYPHNGRTTEDLVLTAKKALFEAQRSGRNSVVHFPALWYAKPGKTTEPEHI